MSDPIILTALFDDEAQERFDALRERWFPPKLNMIPAHVTLFHHLPGEKEEQIREALEDLAGKQAPFSACAGPPRKLGGGVAIGIDAPELEAFRERIAERFRGDLTKQDSQPFRPHLTIQNKVTSATAKASFGVIEDSFTPILATVRGVAMWRYKKGPWESAGHILFEG